MNFFCTKEHYDRWAARTTQDLTAAYWLDLASALLVSGWIFAESPAE